MSGADEKIRAKLRDLAEDLRQKSLFNESQRSYNELEWMAVAFEQKRISDELRTILDAALNELMGLAAAQGQPENTR